MTLAALGDAAYNIGPRIICDPKKSTLARQLKNGNVKAACEELPKWDKAKVNGKMVSLPGLTKRRALEKAMCLDGLAGLQQSGRASSGGTK